MTLVTLMITSTQYVNLPAGITKCNVFLKGGGGGGAKGLATYWDIALGGGAGSEETHSSISVSPGSYLVVVGTGGPGGTAAVSGGDGESSSAFGYTVSGGVYRGQSYTGSKNGDNGYGASPSASNGFPSSNGNPGGLGGVGYGSGGGGGGSGYTESGSDTPGNGGAGAPGVVIITYYQPSISFSGTPEEGTAPETISFTASADESPTGWAWTFGDGGTSASQNPSNTYTLPGKYTVSLTVTNAYGNWTLTKTDYISMYWEPSTQIYFLMADPRGA